jgi:hypothetical protein
MTATTPTSQPPPAASPNSSPNPNPKPSGPPPPNAPSLGTTSHPTPPSAPLPPLTGVQSALEHTGIPRSVLTWKPRLPSRNWSIFLTVSGTLFYLWWDDRRQCKIIKEETLRKVEHLGKEPLAGSLDDVRKIKVYGARWPDDGDEDRALRHFRKYMKVSGVRICELWNVRCAQAWHWAIVLYHCSRFMFMSLPYAVPLLHGRSCSTDCPIDLPNSLALLLSRY